MRQDEVAYAHLVKSNTLRQRKSMIVEEDDLKDEMQKESGFHTSNERSAKKEDDAQSN